MLERILGGPSLDIQPILREIDPASVQRVLEGNYVKRLIGEAQVASRKCYYYAGNCLDPQISDFFKQEAKLIDRSAKLLEKYFESMTKEAKH